MDLKDRIIELKKSQQRILDEYNQIIADVNTDGIIQENAELKKTLAEYSKELAQFKQNVAKLTQENNKLKSALYEQLLNEKLSILKITNEKLQTYFKNELVANNDRLSELVQITRSRLDRLKEIAEKRLTLKKEEFNIKIKELEQHFEAELRREAQEYQQSFSQISNETTVRRQELETEGISQATIEKRIRQNQWEFKIGLNLINKLGILLILIGVGAFFRYSYENFMTDQLRALCFFVLGGAFLVGGEWFYRKKQQIFATGLLGGGIAILYLSIFNSVFGFKIMDLQTALLISVLLALVTVILSIRYSSQTIAAMALIGGFLPFVFYSSNYPLTGMLVPAMGYLLIFNLILLAISLKKRWDYIKYLSFLMNIPAMVFLVFQSDLSWLTIGYSLLTFIMYIVTVMSFPVIYQARLRVGDYLLLGLNTIINCIIVYYQFIELDLHRYLGLFAMIFCVSYLALGQYIRRRLAIEKAARIMFYATALGFAVLIVPFQFNIVWWPLGWLVQGMVMMFAGAKNKYRGLEFSGWGIFGLCIVSFYLVTLWTILTGGSGITLKYSIIIVGKIAVLLFYLYLIHRNEIPSLSPMKSFIMVYKYYTIIAVWIFLLYSSYQLSVKLIPLYYQTSFINWILVALVTSLLGLSISRIPLLVDRAVKGLSWFFYIIADLIGISLTLSYPVLTELQMYSSLKYYGLAVLFVMNILVFLNIKTIIKLLLTRETFNIDNYSFWLGLILLGNITVFLMFQLNLSSTSLIISISYLIMAVSYISYGFSKRLVLIRRLGLGLILFATAKLFLYDLAFLKTGGRIIAYFVFGFVLLLISLIYQRIKNSLEAQNEVNKIL
ncbi:MAG TPA: DUF2339 domain-containing protein [Bacillota bacterium]|nr:DUF2339 domain-containing protein [Bacillota bacterium]HOL10576.1 DUF2339 domain-containing protein [Bacillota bacterium]HPO98278.1 DUF2339 domain-containing protein [Bacillota bacterium]